MSIFLSKSIKQLRENIAYLRAAQKVTAHNIAQSNTPEALPYKVEKTSFSSNLHLAQPHGGQGFINNSTDQKFKVTPDYDNASEATNGESRISIENESVRMAELDDEHNITLKLLSSWKKGVRIVIGNGG
jgi:flagellar basal body rod protein FlgB